MSYQCPHYIKLTEILRSTAQFNDMAAWLHRVCKSPDHYWDPVCFRVSTRVGWLKLPMGVYVMREDDVLAFKLTFGIV